MVRERLLELVLSRERILTQKQSQIRHLCLRQRCRPEPAHECQEVHCFLLDLRCEVQEVLLSLEVVREEAEKRLGCRSTVELMDQKAVSFVRIKNHRS